MNMDNIRERRGADRAGGDAGHQAPGTSSAANRHYTSDSHRTYCPYPQIPAPLQTSTRTGGSTGNGAAPPEGSQMQHTGVNLQTLVEQQLQQLLPAILPNHIQALQQPLTCLQNEPQLAAGSSVSSLRADLTAPNASLANQKQAAPTSLAHKQAEPLSSAVSGSSGPDLQPKEELMLQVNRVIDDRLQAIKDELVAEADRRVQERVAALQAAMERRCEEQSQVMMGQMQQLVETMRDMQARLGQQMEANNDIQARNLVALREQLVNLLPATGRLAFQPGSPRQQAPAASTAAAAAAAAPPQTPPPAAVPAAGRAAAPAARPGRLGPGELACPMCAERFLNEDVLQVHLFTDHNVRADQQQAPAAGGGNHQPRNNAPAGPLQCFICNKDFEAQDLLEVHVLTDHPELMYDGHHNLDRAFGTFAAAPSAPPAAAAGTFRAAAGRGAGAGAHMLLVRVRYGADQREATLRLPRDATVGQLRDAIEVATGHEPWMLLGPSVAIRSTTDAAARIDSLFSANYLASGEIQLTMAMRPNSARSIAA